MRNLSGEKLFVSCSYSILSTNIDTIKIFYVLHNKVALLTKYVLSGEQEIVAKDSYQRIFRKVLPNHHIHIARKHWLKVNFYDPEKLRLVLNILECIWWSFHSSFLFMAMGKRWCKVIYLCFKIRKWYIQPQPKYKTIYFLNLGSLNKKLSSLLADFGCLRV